MVRIQLDLPEEQVKELDELMRETHIGTRKDLFNNAMDEENGTAKELVMPALENVSGPIARRPPVEAGHAKVSVGPSR